MPLNSTAPTACLIKFLRNVVFAYAQTASMPLSSARLYEQAIAKRHRKTQLSKWLAGLGLSYIIVLDYPAAF